MGDRTDLRSGAVQAGVRRLVRESWQRSLSLRLDPLTAQAAPTLAADELNRLRARNPLAGVLPVINTLLVRHAAEFGLIVAVADETGRLLWIDGDSSVRTRAEDMHFVVGADWSEARVGTSAPGTALALNHGIQIQRAEHFSQLAHPFSCTAVPIHDPVTGAVLGVIDITGGDAAVAPQTLPLVEAAVAALEAELRIQSLSAPRPAPARPSGFTAPGILLTVLGTEHGALHGAPSTDRHSTDRHSTDRHSVGLSPRHAEILLLLAWHRQGLSADRLASLLSDEQPHAVENLRAEMVRLRRALAVSHPQLRIGSRPYRLETGVDTDAGRVLRLLGRGAHRMALAAYRGTVLPGSAAPGVTEIRAEVSQRLRQTLLSDASVEVLLDYARTEEAAWDSEVWRACLQLLPARSPQRAAVVASLARIEAELSA
ncbi:GAF domain-containing protein [Cryobacterium sp. TMB3-1-2]|nr:GAF domain-containing protein [Cryobacterium sp. TMB3-1-2]TFC73024.1 GAF domain-containing protein [Cryobacterium sp. TMB3-15]TFC76569.1 GAF domain-containing protein [Cryobacterium sp. TMB3-10]TFD43695.1 GAF domain-containing protein [Cryobacterium sp. TMB3-12]